VRRIPYARTRTDRRTAIHRLIWSCVLVLAFGVSWAVSEAEVAPTVCTRDSALVRGRNQTLPGKPMLALKSDRW
jgi:hypothetical protein